MRAGWVVAILGLFVSVAGGWWAWDAVDEYKTACGRRDAVGGRLNDVRASIDAQLDEAVGQVSVTAGWPGDNSDLAGMLDDIFERAEADPGDFREEILTRHQELLDGADDGALDERLVAGLSGALRDLDDDVVRPLSSDADDRYDDVRNRASLVGFVSIALWGVVLVTAVTRARRA